MEKKESPTPEEILSKKTTLTINQETYLIQTDVRYILEAMEEYSELRLKEKMEELVKKFELKLEKIKGSPKILTREKDASIVVLDGVIELLKSKIK
jgi:hypothetical protein